jgi:hypothetical protein
VSRWAHANSMDATTRRFERDAVVACLGFAAAALLWPGAGVGAAVAVLGGGVLAALSYLPLKSVANLTNSRAETRFWPLVKFFTRHAILALAGYGMMTRLKLDPVGLLTGVSAPVAAVALEAFRVWRGAQR